MKLDHILFQRSILLVKKEGQIVKTFPAPPFLLLNDNGPLPLFHLPYKVLNRPIIQRQKQKMDGETLAMRMDTTDILIKSLTLRLTATTSMRMRTWIGSDLRA